MRPAHALKVNKTVGFPVRWVFFDVETRTVDKTEEGAEQGLVTGWAVSVILNSDRQVKRQTWFRFEKAGEFWNFVKAFTRKAHKVVLCAHNIAFDFTVLRGFEGLDRLGFYPKTLYLGGGVVIGKWVDRTPQDYEREKKEIQQGTRKRVSPVTTIELRDSVNYYRMPLARVGSVLGLEKLDCDVLTADVEELSIYCHRDVEILQAAVLTFLRFVGEHDLGFLAPTVSSQAFTAFRHRYYHRTIYIHNRGDVCNVERSAYFGGRTEAFFIGDYHGSSVSVLDVNSLYPSVMRGNLFPRKLEMRLRESTLTRLGPVLDQKCLIAKCQIETDTPCYPLRHEGRLVFPIGSFETTLCSPEMRMALERGHLKGISNVCVYDPDEMFTDYVDALYALRLKLQTEGNKPYSQLAKDLMNHLYGKWGQMGDNWEEIGTCDPSEIRIEEIFDLDLGRTVQTRFLGGRIERLIDREESYNSFAAIAAHTTSYARVKLWGLIEKAGRENVLYCDTDSLFVNQAGYHRIEGEISPATLGKLKVEKQVEKLEVYGAKDYVLDGIVKLKGIRKNAQQISPGVYRQDQFPSFKAALRSPDPNVYRIKTIVKRLSRDYRKGTVLSTGVVVPLVFPLP